MYWITTIFRTKINVFKYFENSAYENIIVAMRCIEMGDFGRFLWVTVQQAYEVAFLFIFYVVVRGRMKKRQQNRLKCPKNQLQMINRLPETTSDQG